MAKTSKAKILGMLTRHKAVRAALQVDPEGKVKAREGQALALQTGASSEEPTMMMPIDGSKEGPQEAVYIADFDGDFLVVIFDEDAEFDELKQDIDETVANFL